MTEKLNVDIADSLKPRNVSLVVDTGTEIGMIVIPKAGTVDIQNVTEEPVDFIPDMSTVSHVPEKITHVVLTIPVFQNEDGTYYSIRNMKNID